MKKLTLLDAIAGEDKVVIEEQDGGMLLIETYNVTQSHRVGSAIYLDDTGIKKLKEFVKNL